MDIIRKIQQWIRDEKFTDAVTTCISLSKTQQQLETENYVRFVRHHSVIFMD